MTDQKNDDDCATPPEFFKKVLSFVTQMMKYHKKTGMLHPETSLMIIPTKQAVDEERGEMGFYSNGKPSSDLSAVLAVLATLIKKENLPISITGHQTDTNEVLFKFEHGKYEFNKDFVTIHKADTSTHKNN